MLVSVTPQGQHYHPTAEDSQSSSSSSSQRSKLSKVEPSTKQIRNNKTWKSRAEHEIGLKLRGGYKDIYVISVRG